MGMNRDVYSFLFKAYGLGKEYRAGFVFTQTLMMYAAAPLLRITTATSLWQKQTEHGSQSSKQKEVEYAVA